MDQKQILLIGTAIAGYFLYRSYLIRQKPVVKAEEKPKPPPKPSQIKQKTEVYNKPFIPLPRKRFIYRPPPTKYIYKARTQKTAKLSGKTIAITKQPIKPTTARWGMI